MINNKEDLVNYCIKSGAFSSFPICERFEIDNKQLKRLINNFGFEDLEDFLKIERIREERDAYVATLAQDKLIDALKSGERLTDRLLVYANKAFVKNDSGEAGSADNSESNTIIYIPIAATTAQAESYAVNSQGNLKKMLAKEKEKLGWRNLNP